MAWVKIDDGWLNHHKVLTARANGGWAALGVWAGALTWVNQQRTDGFLPASWVALNGASDEIAALVDAGLLVEDASRDGWQFHDYADYQPTRAEIEAKTEQRAAAGKRGGSKSQANRKQTASNLEATSNPVPVPGPVTTPNGVVSATRISAKEARTRKRLGLEVVEGPGGTAA